jgi:hypothetical protein
MKFEELEIWDVIQGFENYKVSSHGNVYSIRRNKILKPVTNRYGYKVVKLCKYSKQYQKTIHRLVAQTFLFIDDYETKEIDHIDNDKANNFLLNLRACTHKQNCRNRGKYKNNTSGFRGVCYFKRDNKWIASINENGKHIHLGLFQTAEEAYEKYKQKAKELHKDFYCDEDN